MSIKEFNNQYKSISKNYSGYPTLKEADLDCLLKETILASHPENIVAEVQYLPQTLDNLHQIIRKFDPKSGAFIQSMKLVEKVILALKNEPNVIQMVPILPVLTDILLRSPSRIEHILKLIETVSFGSVIKIRQPYLERLVKFCVDTLSDETVVHGTAVDLDLRKVALAVLINLCSNNGISLIILEQQINLVDLQQMIPLSTYGILTCKMDLILNEYELHDKKIRNFLKYATQELHRIPSHGNKSLKHLVEFIRDISKRVNMKNVMKDYDFCSEIQAAIMTLEKNTNDNIAVQTNALFEVVTIVMGAKNALLKNLSISIIDFANKRLKDPETRVQAIETLTTVFNNDANVTPENFDLDDMKATLSAILFGSDRHTSVLGPLFKLLTTLAKSFQVNILNNQIVDTIFAPLVKPDSSKYSKWPVGDAIMYLECLVTVSTSLNLGIGDIRSNLFQEENIQFLVAMSIKHGTTEQCCLALSLVNRFSKEEISVIISDKNNVSKVFEAENEMQHTQSYGLEKETGVERLKDVFDTIEKACLENRIDQVPTTDFIELYSNEVADLKQQIKTLTKKYEEMSHEFDLLMGQKLQVQATAIKWSELAQNLQRSNETLLAENDRLNVIVTSLRYKLKSSLEQKEESLRRLGQEKNEASKKTKEMEEKVHTLEDELKDIEDLRQTVLSLMSKRKKPSAKET